ncbi:MAG: BLUF domain-containing protein [Janthinobacterium lividum]
MVFSLMYSSTTDHDWSQDELVTLLDWSRGWNLDHDVTGLLLYRDCAFMQFLEGDEPVVRELFSHISVDRRHQDVDLMWTNGAERRRFADWSMAFRELGSHPVAQLGYNDALNEPPARHGGVLVDFLSMFSPA